jgi:hypothetical protein
MIRRILTLGLVVAAPAVARANSDFGTTTALDAVGEKIGWSFHLSPPDPCTPPDPCKIKLASTIDTSVRPDLAHEVTFARNTGDVINPCVKVLHTLLGDGTMLERIDVLGTDDVVTITVPGGSAFRQNADGSYSLGPIDIVAR